MNFYLHVNKLEPEKNEMGRTHNPGTQELLFCTVSHLQLMSIYYRV